MIPTVQNNYVKVVQNNSKVYRQNFNVIKLKYLFFA